MTLFLALVAIQFVVESDLPKASYVIPTRQLVIASYVALSLIAIETMVVYNVFNWHRVGEYFRGHKRALAKRAELKRRALGLPDGVHTNRVARALQSTLTRVTTFRRTPKAGPGRPAEAGVPASTGPAPSIAEDDVGPPAAASPGKRPRSAQAAIRTEARGGWKGPRGGGGRGRGAGRPARPLLTPRAQSRAPPRPLPRCSWRTTCSVPITPGWRGPLT